MWRDNILGCIMSQERLRVSEVPRYPFVGHPIELNVQLIKDTRLICGEDNPIAVRLLCISKEGVVVDECENDVWVCTHAIMMYLHISDHFLQSIKEIVDCEKSDLSIPKSGSVKYNIIIHEPSMLHANRDFVIEVSCLSKRYEDMQAVCSEPMFVVTHRLLVETPLPSLFYKDLGGKDSCVEFVVSLRDHNNNIVQNRRVQLAPELLYENGRRKVPAQSILSVVGDQRQLVIGPDGRTTLKMRINEVSRSHQKQLFVIKVCADTEKQPLLNDIAPDFTTAVDVMSKPRPSKQTQGTGGTTEGTKRPLDEDAEEQSRHKAARIMGECGWVEGGRRETQ